MYGSVSNPESVDDPKQRDKSEKREFKNAQGFYPSAAAEKISRAKDGVELLA